MQHGKGNSSGRAPVQVGKGYDAGLSHGKGGMHGVQDEMMAALQTLLTMVGSAGSGVTQGRGWAPKELGRRNLGARRAGARCRARWPRAPRSSGRSLG